MSVSHKSRYCNTPIEIVFDSLLLIAIAGSHIPQINRVRNLPSTHGLSPSYIPSNALFSTAQLSHALFLHAYGWPYERRTVLETIAEGRLEGISAYGALLGLLQIFAQWTCSIALVTAYSHGSTNGTPNGSKIAIEVFLYAATVLFPAVAIALPKPSPHSWGVDVPVALITMANMVTAPLFLLLQFWAQCRECGKLLGDPGALSMISLCFQVPVTAILAVRWFVRLGEPPWVPRGNFGPYFGLWVWDTLSALYWWGMLAINYSLWVVGCVVLLGCYYTASRGERFGARGESTPLLA